MRAPALLLAVFVLVGAPFASFAQQPRQVGDFVMDSGGRTATPDAMALFVADGPNRVATLTVVVDDGDHVIGFLFRNPAEWNRFVTLWDKARHTKPPADGAVAVGSYFDEGQLSLAQISVSAGGTIILTCAGDLDPKTKAPQALSTFNVSPYAAGKFDANIAVVTAHFAGSGATPPAAPATAAEPVPAPPQGERRK